MENNNEFKEQDNSFGEMERVAEKAKDFKQAFKKFMIYIKPHKLVLLIIIILAVLSTVFSIVGPRILGDATTVLFDGIISQIMGTGSGIDFNKIKNILLILLGIYGLSFILSYIQGFMMVKVANKITIKLRKDIQEKINKLPLKYFDKHNYGEVLSYMSNDVDVISQNLNQSFTQIITSVVSIIGIMIMMLTISWQMTLIALVVLPIAGVLMGSIVGKSQKYFALQQENMGHVNGHVEEVYGSHVIVKTFNGQKEVLNKFDTYNDNLYNATWKSQFLSGLMWPIISFVSNIGYVVICILGAYFASRNMLSVGDIQAFIQYMQSFMQPIGTVASSASIFQSMAAAAERIFEFLEQEEDIPDATDTIDISNIVGNNSSNRTIEFGTNSCITFNNVHFGYDEDKIVINDFSAQIKPGQKIAIVGPTGAGKTTIVKLLMRFYELNSGSIEIDGINISKMKRSDLRSTLGMVLQDTWLYKDTIRENIRYGNLAASDNEVYEVAKIAQVDHFIRTLSDGYDTIINEEASNISQGQKQLLTIARAFLSNPKILILDEATSSIDTRTELLIQKAMDKLMEGRTSFVIAHRLSTIKNADLILVMDKGDIIEQGTHQQLLDDSGFYANLYNSQFEG